MKRKKTLRKARERKGWNQSLLAQRAGIKASRLSLCENGYINPSLNEMMTLEEKLGTKIKWHEQLEDYQKAILLNSIGILMDEYPAKTVIEFANQQFTKIDKCPVETIKNYSDFLSNDEILLPPNIQDNDN